MLVGAARPAAAQNADAEALFNEAVRLEDADRIDEACDAFEASNRIEPRAGTLIRLGQCREMQDRLASAWSAYKDALTRAKDPRKRAIAEERVAALEPRLSYLTVSVPDESRVDGLAITRNGVALDRALWNRSAPVDGGSYVIAGQAPGHEEWATTVEIAVEGAQVSVEVPRFKELRELAPPPPPDDEGIVPPVPGMWTTRRKIGAVVAGAGIVAVLAGGVLGAQARGLETDAYALCPDPATPCADDDRAQALLDQGRSRALVANVSYGAGAAAIVAGAVLWLTGAPESVTVTPRASRDGARVDVAWRF